MELEPDQVYAQLGPIVFGAVDEFGVDWSLVELDGWGASRTSRRLQQRARQGGSWASKGFSAGRSVSLSGKVFAPSAQALQAAFDRLNDAADVNEARLIVTEAGLARWADVGRSDDVLWRWLSATEASWSVQVESEEWRKFGALLQDTTTLPSTSGGLTVPFTVPFTINATTVTGQVSLTNPGNAPGPVVLRIDGPVRGPIITHVSSGAQLVFSSSIVIGAGEFLLVDMDAHEVLANGQAGRNGWITSRGWSAFDPGVNTWGFTAAAFDPASRLTVMATPAWK